MANTGSDTTLATIGLGSLSTTNGTDLVGTIDGVAGVAAGNVLSGAVGSNAAGMSINVSSTAGGTIVVSNGVTNQFSELVESVVKDDNALDLRIDLDIVTRDADRHRLASGPQGRIGVDFRLQLRSKRRQTGVSPA